MSMPGFSELIVIFAIALLLFGGKRLPGLAGALGESVKNFRKGLKETENDAQLDSATLDSTKTDKETKQPPL